MNTTDIMQFVLVGVSDMREFNYERNEYQPLERGQGNICERCGKEHAKVFVLEDTQTKKLHYVGSVCARHMRFEPTKEVIALATKQFRQQQVAQAKATYLQTVAQPLAHRVLAMQVPEIILEEVRKPDLSSYPTIYVYACGKKRLATPEKSLSADTCNWLIREWRQDKVYQLVREYLGEGADSKRVMRLENAIMELF